MMNDVELFELGTHVFTGTIKARRGPFTELVTDSGLTVAFTTEGNRQLTEGARVTIVVRKYLPRYHMIRVSPA